MRTFRPIVVALALMSFVGCATNHAAYTLDQVELSEVRGAADGSVVVTYRTMAETLFFCPGADVKETGDALLLSLVRSSIHDSPQVDLPCSAAAAEGWHDVVVKDALDRRILLDDGVATREIWNSGRR